LSELPSRFETPENIDKRTCYIACAEAPLLPNTLRPGLKKLVVGGFTYIALVLFCFYFVPFLGHNIFSTSRLSMLTSELLNLTIFCLFCRLLGLFLDNPGFLDISMEKSAVFAIIGLFMQPNLPLRRRIGDSKQPIIGHLETSSAGHWAWKQLKILLLIYSYYFRAQYLMLQLFGNTRTAGLIFATFSLIIHFILQIIWFFFRNKVTRRGFIFTIFASTTLTILIFWIFILM
jgi:hypothetical protein